jgi:hypothetical protein
MFENDREISEFAGKNIERFGKESEKNCFIYGCFTIGK